MSDVHTWNVEIVGEVIGYIHIDSQFYGGPFNPGELAIVMLLIVGNSGSQDGTVYWKLYEYPGEVNENLINSGDIFVTQGGIGFVGDVVATVPVGITLWPLGVKVWGETETEPTAWGTMGALLLNPIMISNR